MKKILALVIAALMLLSMTAALAGTQTPVSTIGTTTLATHTISASDPGNHTYDVYQVFAGIVDSGELTSLVYGASTVSTKTAGEALSQADIDVLAGLDDSVTRSSTYAAQQAVLDTLSGYVNFSNPIGQVNSTNTSISVPEGYYLIRDTVNSAVNAEEDGAYSLYIVQVADDDITISPKTETTTHEKKIDDVNDSDNSDYSNLRDSADYDIGDWVPYHLKATIAQNVSAYHTYHLTFEDTLEDGKFDAISALTIKVGNTNAVTGTFTGYTVAVTGADPTEDGFTKTVTFTAPTDERLPASLAGVEVTIDFSAQLGEGANIGAQGNLNTFVLKYSNNPNSSDDSEEGTTPGDTVIAFTYELDVNKKDEKGDDLDGATFTLYKKYTDEKLAATGKTAVQSITYGNNQTYTIADGDNWVQVNQIVGTSQHLFQFPGLDAGDYLLVETTAPTNYNPIAPQTFTVTATHTLDWTTGTRDTVLTALSAAATGTSTIEFTSTLSTGVISTDITNKSGIELPSTGGIGTTIFYVGGGLLVLAAVILLVTKRRMSGND